LSSGITSLAFSPDGSRLASTGWDTTGVFVDLFDGRTRRLIARLGGADLTYVEDPSVHFSPDSRVLSLRAADGTSTRIWRWDAGAGRQLADFGSIPGSSSALLGFVGSAARLVTSSPEDHATVIRSADTLRSLRRIGAAGSAAALSSAAGLVAIGARDGSVRLIDVRTGDLRTARGRHEAPVVAMRFDPGGERLVTAGRDERLIVWDPARATVLETLEARGIGLVQDLQVAGDGRTAYSAGRDGVVIAWDLSGERRWERPFGEAGARRLPGSLSAAARGSHLAVIDARGFVDLFESRTLRRTVRIRPGRRGVAGAAVAPDGRMLVIATERGELEFWDTRTRRRVGEPLTAHADAAWVLSFSADGRWLATGGGDSMVRIWDARRRAPAANAPMGNVADLSLSPDGTMLAATHTHRNFDGGLEIRSVPSLELIRTLPVPVGTVGRFSPDGRSLNYGDRDGRVWTFDTRTWRPRGRTLQAHPGILTADLAPDGRLLATTSTDGTGGLWDVASGRPIGGTLSGGSGDPIDAAFIRRGSHLVVLHERGAVVWDVRPRSWARHACAVAGRPLTRAEWEIALPRHDYTPACAPP
jgi:WD40 repeat protein